MLNEKVKCSFTEIPFKSFLSFEYLIAEIDKVSRQKNHPMQKFAQDILKDLEKTPALKKSIKNIKIVKENQELIDRLMSFVINPLEDESVLSAINAPFQPKPIHSTTLFRETFTGSQRKIELAKDLDQDNMLLAIIYQAYLIILARFYSFQCNVDIPFIFKFIEDGKTVKYYKLLVNSIYADIKFNGTLPELSEKELKSLFDHSNNLDHWNEKIPLEKFEFHGFLHFTYIDVTHDHIVSQLKSDLLDKHSIVSLEGFERIREKVRALVGIPDLEFGLSAFSEFESLLNQQVIWKNILPESELHCDDYIESMYDKAYHTREIVLTDDLRKVNKNKVVNLFLANGVHSHAVVPLQIDGEIVGMVEFGAMHAGQLSMFQLRRLHELYPVFAIALKRSRDELNDRVRAIIQKECTAIHPSVEWRFQEAASNMLDEKLENGKKRMERIIFSDVVPVYGATDIRNSSLERNRAIQADLKDHLTMAKKILRHSLEEIDMPLLNHLVYRVDEHLKTVNAGLKAGDEVSILEFLKKDIEPVFTQMRGRDTKMADKVWQQYFKRMDPDLGVFYNKRKDFEDSVTQINNCIAHVLDEEQVRAQKIYPHYFEKYRTDGIEYNAYIGQSLINNLKFDQIYLKNIRLWQLLAKVKIARHVRELTPNLPIKLDVAQLILVHSNPLSIAFRQDEKKFDVAGAYNIRYEITKKRIDKALINGTNERITQVGKIAIIYSHAEEIEEYEKYIEYLIAQNYLEKSVEHYELEDLKGASGLQALRVTVNYRAENDFQDINISEMKEAIEHN